MEIIESQAECFVADNDNLNNFTDQMKGVDALVIRVCKVDAEAIAKCPDLKVIGRPGAGYDSIDEPAATAAGIPIVLAPGVNSRSVAEHTLAMMFAMSKNLLEGHNGTAAGEFYKTRNLGKIFLMEDKMVGILGLGAVGKQVAKLCQGIGMKTCGFDPFLTREQVEALGCVYYDDYEKMLPECDFVSLHMPLVESTVNMISKKQLQSMKRSAYLVNCARGGIVNEQDLIEALNNEVIAGAAVDVFAHEPPAAADPLFTAKNLIASPHCAALSDETMTQTAAKCMEGCVAVIRGEKWPLVANKAVYDHPRWKNRTPEQEG